MKYHGNIVAIAPKNYQSIYSASLGDDAHFWIANIKSTFRDGFFEIDFLYGSYIYKLILKRLKEFEFSGTIIRDNEDAGKVHAIFYENKNGLFFKGTWNEHDTTPHYDCFIEMKRIEIRN